MSLESRKSCELQLQSNCYASDKVIHLIATCIDNLRQKEAGCFNLFAITGAEVRIHTGLAQLDIHHVIEPGAVHVGNDFTWHPYHVHRGHWDMSICKHSSPHLQVQWFWPTILNRNCPQR